jgi:hypothetical protein
MSEYDERTYRTAVHEAGHAVMACLTGLTFAAVTIEGSAEHGFTGCLVWNDEQPITLPIHFDLSEHEPYVLTLAAGYVAECEVFGRLGESDVVGALHDMGQIASIAAEVMPAHGDAMTYVRDISDRVSATLRLRRASLDAIAEQLLRRTRLTCAEVTAIVASRPPANALLAQPETL